MSAPTALTVHLDGIGLQGPGLAGWAASREVLAGRAPHVAAPLQLPPIEALPAAERRRVGMAIKLAFSTGFEAMRQAGAEAEATTLATVFSSSGGDCDNCHAILETLASSDRAVSPTRFHNSVHNAPSGYWSIATACQAPSTSLCAYDGGFAAGLLEAAAQVLTGNAPCLLLAYDSPYPEPLGSCRPMSGPFGVALLLSPQRTAATLATLSLHLREMAPASLDDPALETLRQGTPAARALPLLQRLARRDAGKVALEYLAPMALDVSVDEPA